MEDPLPERSGMLILRVWIEGDRTDGLRARITHALDSGAAEHSVATAATPDDVYAAVQAWLEAFVIGSER